MNVIDNSHMERIQEYVQSFDEGQFAFVKEVDSSWTAIITDTEPVFEVNASSFSEALAEMSKLVYEEQLKTKG